MRPAAEKGRSRRRFGSQLRTGPVRVRVSIWTQPETNNSASSENFRARVAKRNACAYDGFRVVPAGEPDDNVTLLSTQPGTFGSGRTAGEVGHRRAGHKDGIDRREDAALAQRADDPSDTARRQEFLGGFDDEHATVEDVRIEGESPRGEDPFDDLEA